MVSSEKILSLALLTSLTTLGYLPSPTSLATLASWCCSSKGTALDYNGYVLCTFILDSYFKIHSCSIFVDHSFGPNDPIDLPHYGFGYKDDNDQYPSVHLYTKSKSNLVSLSPQFSSLLKIRLNPNGKAIQINQSMTSKKVWSVL